MSQIGSQGAKKKVVIVGGGYAALTAAFELTKPRDSRSPNYDVSVYTAGWRLGGKAASSRSNIAGVEGNRAIVERAPHLWMGWYENAFQLIRELYGEWTGDADAWRDAFDTATVTAAPLKASAANAQLWKFDLPPGPGLPGDLRTVSSRRTVGDVLARLWAFTATILDSLGVAGTRLNPIAGRSLNEGIGALLRGSSLLEPLGLSTFIQLVESAGVSASVMASQLPWFNGQGSYLSLRRVLADPLRRQLGRYLDDSEERKRFWELVDVVLASTRGLTHATLNGSSLRDLDQYDYCEWLRQYGAADASINSPVMRGMHAMGMGCKGGDRSQLCVATGAGLWGFIRTLFYRGDYLWQLARGPGEDVFVPLYEVLMRRGVRFHFFHRLRGAHFENRHGSPHVTALDFDLQAKAKGDYDPLLGSGQTAYWPDAPLWDRLEDGTDLKHRADSLDLEAHRDDTRVPGGLVRLSAGEHFDYVVLGTGVAATGDCCAALIGSPFAPRVWREMFVAEARDPATVHDPAGTVATQSFQLWLRAPLKDLGLPGPPLSMAGFDWPFDCCVDLRHRIYSENWRESADSSVPRGMLHFRGFVKDRDLTRPDGALWGSGETQHSADRFFATHIKELLPDAVDRNGRLRDSLKVGVHYSANTDPNFRSPQMLPGATCYRLRPQDASVPNLRVCGDWTDCGVNTPSAESAIMSARLAAVSIMAEGDDRQLLQVPGFAETQGSLFKGIWDTCYA